MPHANWVEAASTRLYRAFLRAYPTSFRQTYGAEMELLFRQCCRAALRRSGIKGVGRLWLHTLQDLLTSATTERLSEFNDGGITMLAKRGMDVALSLFALVAAAPLLVLIALLIKLDSPGPVLYKSTRIGKAGRPFQMLKFRSMAADPATPGAQRVTRVGQVLRRTALDEFPQMVNVLKGEMSIVGPRPALPTAVAIDDPTWQQLFSIRPGITGLAQVTYGHTKPAVSLPSRQELDLRYLRSRSLRGDMRLLGRQFIQLLRP